MYSSAIWTDESDTLEIASTRKLERICRKLDLKPSDRVIEIGTGWGGFALYAAQHYGCHVTITTISCEQHALASERVAASGLGARVDLLLEDYRDLRGQYDKLVSIGERRCCPRSSTPHADSLVSKKDQAMNNSVADFDELPQQRPATGLLRLAERGYPPVSRGRT